MERQNNRPRRRHGHPVSSRTDIVSRTVTIATFNYPAEAQFSQAKLAAESIRSWVVDGNTISANPLYSLTMGGSRLKVSEADAEQASRILKQVGKLDAGQAGIVKPDRVLDSEQDAKAEEFCPQCGSADIQYEHLDLRRMRLAKFFLGYPLPILKGKWKCNNCGYEWEEDDE